MRKPKSSHEAGTEDAVHLLCLFTVKSIQLDYSFYVDRSLFNFVWMTCNSIADVDSSAVYKQNFGNPKQVLLIAFLLIEGM